MAANVGDEALSAQLAQKAVEDSPKATVADIVARVIQDTRPVAPKPTKSTNPKRKAAVIEQFDALDEDDVRRIAFTAFNNGAGVGAALQQAGYLKLCLEDALV